MRNQIVSKGNHWITLRGKGRISQSSLIKLDFAGDNCWCPCQERWCENITGGADDSIDEDDNDYFEDIIGDIDDNIDEDDND